MNHRAQLEEEIKKFDYNNGKIRLTFGVLVVAVLCSFLIVMATFTKISFIDNKLPIDAIITHNIELKLLKSMVMKNISEPIGSIVAAKKLIIKSPKKLRSVSISILFLI